MNIKNAHHGVSLGTFPTTDVGLLQVLYDRRYPEASKFCLTVGADPHVLMNNPRNVRRPLSALKHLEHLTTHGLIYLNGQQWAGPLLSFLPNFADRLRDRKVFTVLPETPAKHGWNHQQASLNNPVKTFGFPDFDPDSRTPADWTGRLLSVSSHEGQTWTFRPFELDDPKPKISYIS